MIGSEFSAAEIEEAARHGRLLSMEIEFSLKCNFRCQYCYISQGDASPRELTHAEIRDAILQAKALGARKIIVLGGEPMIYPATMEMLEFIRGQGLSAEMFTNGTKMTAEAAHRLFELGVQVVLKMNSRVERVQDELAGARGAYATIQAAFRNLRAAGYPSDSRLMGVSTVICAQNLSEIVPLWQWLRDQKIIPYFEIITPQGNAKRNKALDVPLQTLHDLFRQLSDLDRTRYGYTWDPQPPLAGDRCLRHQFSCLVNAFGDVMPCVGVTLPVGNIRERKLAEIIRDSEVVQDLRNHRQTIRAPCATCDKASVCYGCRGAAYQLTGDYLAADPLCWRNAERLHEIEALPADAGPMMPHRAPMRLIERLVSVGERVAVAQTVLRPGNPFADAQGNLDPPIFLELIAQTAAVMNGFRDAHRENGAVEGYLLGARQLEVQGTARTGDSLLIRVFKGTRYGDFGVIEGQVFRGADLLAKGEIKVWHKTAQSAEARPGA